MIRWFGRRIVAGILVLFAVSSIVFVVTNVFTDPAVTSLPVDASEQQRAQRRAALGLDRPLAEQYVDFVTGFARLDIGDSFWQKRPAQEIVLDRLPNTLRLIGLALTITVAASVVLGTLSAVYRRRFPDSAILGFSLAGISAPPFWVAYLLIIVFAVRLGLFPTSGSQGFRSSVLPAVALSLASIGRLTQMLRQAILDELRQPYVLTSESRGFTRWHTISHHVARNVAAGFITFSGWELTRMFTGYSVVIEVVFAWPGVGLLAFEAVEHRDLILLQGAVLMLAALVVLTNFTVDVLRRVVDPRVELA